jgi:hypothetical protein
MSQEEKLARAAHMEADASLHVREQRRRADEGREQKAAAAAEQRAAGAGTEEARKGALFLKEMGASAVEEMSMGERMQRNRHYQQKDAGVENFLKPG